MSTTTLADTQNPATASVSCAACNNPTLHAHAACWPCIEQARNFGTQMTEAASGHEDAVRFNRGEAVRTQIGAMLIAYPHLGFREVVDRAIGAPGTGERS